MTKQQKKFHATYDKGFDEYNIIGKVDKEIKDMILDACAFKGQTAFVNSTWLKLDEDLQQIKGFDTVIVYSGPDWENTNCIQERKDAHQFLKDNNIKVVHVGNSFGKNYFSYWLYFIQKHLDKFTPDEFDYTIHSDHRAYMCLNRKPHSHRIQLMEALLDADLIDKGFVSLGHYDGWHNSKFDTLPIVLDVDKGYKLGGEVGGDVGIPNDISSLGHNSVWSRHFLNVVTETVTHTDVFISEKTFKPLLGMRPFLVLGDNRLYEMLKDMGIDTFDDLFGHWWQDPDYCNRIKSIVQIVKRLESMGSQKRLELYRTIENRLIENQTIVIERAKQFEVKIDIND